MYVAVKYNSREEAQGAYKRMLERKRQWIEESEKELRTFAKKVNVVLS